MRWRVGGFVSLATRARRIIKLNPDPAERYSRQQLGVCLESLMQETGLAPRQASQTALQINLF
jgi:hypothetical protein